MTNTHKTKAAADTICNREKALEWLESRGLKLTGKLDACETAIILTPFDGDREDGYVEAVKLLQNFAVIRLPEIVQDAIRCCRNDIEIARGQIAEALGGAE